MKRILITGAGGSAASNFIESIRISGEKFYIVGVDIKPYHIELSNLDKRYLVPSPSNPKYIEILNSIIEKEKIQFVHPQPDPEVYFLAKHRKKIKANIFLPASETVEICQNKFILIETLNRSNINTGEFFLINNKKDLLRAFKVLNKKKKKIWLRAIKGAGSKASLLIADPNHGICWIDYWQKMKGLGWGDFMATEFLPGREFAFMSIWQNGKLITSQGRERLEYLYGYLTPSGQTSTPSVAVTVHRDDVNQVATKSVLAVDAKATGVFCIDMKENEEGVPCVTEINCGRFFTTSNFFAEAGLNIPYLYIKMAYGEKLPNLPQYNPIPAGWYWVRMVDMGYKLIKGDKWTSEKVQAV